MSGEDAVKNYAASVNLTLTSTNITVTGMCNPGNPLTVAVTYPFALQIPFFANTTIPLKYSSTMRIE